MLRYVAVNLHHVAEQASWNTGKCKEHPKLREKHKVNDLKVLGPVLHVAWPVLLFSLEKSKILVRPDVEHDVRRVWGHLSLFSDHSIFRHARWQYCRRHGK